MSSKVYKPYFGPADFRMMREILRRSGYVLLDTAENRTAHLNAAKLLIKEFQTGRSSGRKLTKHREVVSQPDILSWENEGGAIRTNIPPIRGSSPRRKFGVWLLDNQSHD